ncbi:hypothetical protein [Nocardioides bruguierae]|uniref:hypothetical protein n=1 Tax=Nocardioides bruguierae TaxID=2945102 RepID=UPI00202101EF|nr:hypothetical protein [Nocardioides bruguierae]MCL8024876.1 hypothetical protein [Nocardioides bruguierae]
MTSLEIPAPDGGPRPITVEVRALTLPGTPRAGMRTAAGEAWPGLLRLCPHCGSGAHGRPRHPDGRLCSLTYAPGLALLATAEDGRAVGIDVEPDDASAPDLPGIGSLADWVRLEAVLKATGEGLRRDPAAVPASLGWAADVPLPGYVARVVLLDAVPRVRLVPAAD